MSRRTVYHVTTAENAPKILAEGFKPGYGRSGKVWFTDKAGIETVTKNWWRNPFDPLDVLEVTAPTKYFTKGKMVPYGFQKNGPKAMEFTSRRKELMRRGSGEVLVRAYTRSRPGLK